MKAETKHEILEILFVLLTFPISIPMIILLSSRKLSELGRKFPYHPRFINWIWATWARYFWLPCPLCGKNFGGHEWSASLMQTQYSGVGVCPKCVTEAVKRNEESFKETSTLFLVRKP